MVAEVAFKDILTPSQLCEHLRIIAKNHQHYHHYTSLKTLREILSNYTFRLTRATSKSLNDQHEISAKGCFRQRKRMYIGCFNYGQENMAMWGLYGVPHNEGVRISFSKKAMLKMLENTIVQNCGGKSAEYCNIYLSDIAYISGSWGQTEAKFYHGHNGAATIKSANGAALSSLEQFTGIIKNEAWAFENEVRIIAKCDDTNNLPEHIDIEIRACILKDLKITLSPCVSGTTFDELASEFKENYDIEIVKSAFDQLVHFKQL